MLSGCLYFHERKMRNEELLFYYRSSYLLSLLSVKPFLPYIQFIVVYFLYVKYNFFLRPDGSWRKSQLLKVIILNVFKETTSTFYLQIILIFLHIGLFVEFRECQKQARKFLFVALELSRSLFWLKQFLFSGFQNSLR